MTVVIEFPYCVKVLEKDVWIPPKRGVKFATRIWMPVDAGPKFKGDHGAGVPSLPQA